MLMRYSSKLFKSLLWIFSIAVLIVVAVYIAFQASPWPSVLLVRYTFKTEGGSMNESVAKYLPPGIASAIDIPYEPSGRGETLDLYYQVKQDTKRPLIVWVHGGGFIAG